MDSINKTIPYGKYFKQMLKQLDLAVSALESLKKLENSFFEERDGSSFTQTRTDMLLDDLLNERFKMRDKYRYEMKLKKEYAELEKILDKGEKL